jgi:hypothetical protein
MAADWRAYQEETAEFFRSLGLETSTNAVLQGVRTTHNVDVLAKSRHAGFEVTWVIECKHWNSKVSKLHVLALREIVSDLGADRGILLSESGFQSGAAEAAALTNVLLTSLANARKTASADVFAMRLRELYDRAEKCKEQYWSISKADRIDCGLRPEVSDIGYSGANAISLIEDLLRKGLRGSYPFETDFMFRNTVHDFPEVIESVEALHSHLLPALEDLEARLARCFEQLEERKSAV